MATRDQITTALLTEHLRYTPLTLLDDIINTVNELVYQAVNNIETALLNVPPDQLGFSAPAQNVAASAEETEEALETAARTEIESGIVKLESLLNATVDKDFDKLEIYTLRNLLTVSNAKDDEGLEEWVVLEHYKNLQLQQNSQTQVVTKASDRITPEALATLNAQLSETERLHSLLLAEQAKNAALLAQLRPLISAPATPGLKLEEGQSVAAAEHSASDQQSLSFSFLTSTPSAAKLGLSSTGGKSKMAQNTRFTYSQLSSLRGIVNELRPCLKDLKEKGNESRELGVERGVEERVGYIETQARKAMERAGVEGSEGLTGAGEETARRGRDEVVALEAVVGALGGGQTRQKGE